jgi:hypothetical protein
VTGWWRSNALALGVLVVLVPATVLTMSWNEWAEIKANSGSQPITLEPGSTVEYAGATVGPVAARFTDLPLAPPSTRVVAVTLQLDPGEPPITCTAPVLREVGGAQRQWDASGEDLGREWDPDVWSFCTSDATGPYELQLDYLVPDDASGPFVVELESAAGWPEFVSAVIDP